METHNGTGSRRQARPAHPQALSYSVDEAAHVLGVSRRTLYELISENKLKSAKIRGRRLITRASLERLLEESQSLRKERPPLARGGVPVELGET